MICDRLGWLQFLRRFSMLIDAGAAIAPSLHALSEELPPPFDARAGAMLDAIRGGATLTTALKPSADTQPPYLIHLIRAGEVGGVVQVTLARAVALLAEEVAMGKAVDLALDADWAMLTDDWAMTTAPVRLLLTARYCRVVGSLLTSGVPILQTLEVAALLLPVVQQQGAQRTIATIRAHGDNDAIDAMLDYLPPTLRLVFRLGMDSGTLDTALLKAGECYRDEVLT